MYKIKYAMRLALFPQRWESDRRSTPWLQKIRRVQAASRVRLGALLPEEVRPMYRRPDRKPRSWPDGADEKDREAKKGEWDKFKPKPFTTMQTGMVTAFNRYVCYITPPKGDKEAEEQYVEVKYARARTYFESQHWEEAALAFRDVAINHADKDAGIFAAQLYLESVNVLGSRAEPPRPSCFDDLAKDVPTFLELYCKGSKVEDNKEQCESLTRIQFDIMRLKAQKLVEKGDGLSEKGSYKEASTPTRGRESVPRLVAYLLRRPAQQG